MLALEHKSEIGSGACSTAKRGLLRSSFVLSLADSMPAKTSLHVAKGRAKPTPTLVYFLMPSFAIQAL